MENVDGMVGRLVQLVHNAHLATCLCGSREHGIAELVFGDYLAATECEEQATWLDALESLCVESRITFKCVVKCSAMLGESRWVEHNEVVFILVGV